MVDYIAGMTDQYALNLACELDYSLDNRLDEPPSSELFFNENGELH